MTSRSRDRRLRRHAFTLMEMLVVLGILVLLAALVVPRVLGTQKKADINATKVQINMLKGALERYALDMKDFPTTEQGLLALIETPDGTDGVGTSSPSDAWDGPYLSSSELPKDPWGNEYQYEYPATKGKGDAPDIWSFGPDGEDGTEDDICSWTSEETEDLGRP